MRYFQWLERGGSGRVVSATNAMVTGNFSKAMRSSPTITLRTTSNSAYHCPGLAAYQITAISYSSSNVGGYHINIDKASGASGGDIGHIVGDKVFSSSSEL